MEQGIETLLGRLIVILVGLASVTALTGLVLIECGWIVRLGGRLYWRCVSFMETLRAKAQPPYDLRRPGPPADLDHHPGDHPNGAGPSKRSAAQAQETGGDTVERHPDDEGEASA
jgi:hypothetical protein